MTSLVGRQNIVLLGDTDIDTRRDELVELAEKRGCDIVGAYAFKPGEPANHDELTEAPVVLAALRHAVAGHLDIWAPWVAADLGREQHIRRMIMVLGRHGLYLRVGRTLGTLDPEGGVNEIDYALRAEVRAVDNLDNAVLAAIGVEKLSTEIERALSDTEVTRPARAAGPRTTAARRHTPPTLPTPTAPWPQRRREIKRYASWLVHDCGVTQAATARVLNSVGQRTQSGRPWQPGTVSKLVNGGYERTGTAERAGRR